MGPELIQSIAAVLDALAWPVAALLGIVLLRGLIEREAAKGGKVRIGFRELGEISVEPAQGLRPPSGGAPEDPARLTKVVDKPPEDRPPFDYYFLNHTSFLRKDKQAEFRARTGLPLDHYDIRVIVDSYYRGALERVDRVEYVLHRAYPNPVQFRRNREDRFLLKELANGEYVLMARVFMKDRRDPVLLQRYITLWESGPRLS